MLDIELTNSIRDVIIFCVTPFLIVIDLSYRALDLRRVFSMCEEWWCTLADFDIGEVIALLPDRITRIFAAMYWSRHLSWHCLSRSVISSIFAMSCAFCLINAVDLSGLGAGNAFAQVLSACRVLGDRLEASALLVFILPFMLNLLVDYVSLLETRLVLSRVGHATVTRTVILTFIDYSITTLLWSLTFWMLISFVNLIYGSTMIPFVEIDSPFDFLFFPFVYASEYIRDGSIASGQGVPVGHLIGIFSLSTYFTSAVFYLFSVLTVALRLFEALRRRALGLLEYYLEKQRPGPLGVVGLLLAIVAQAVASVASLLAKMLE